jgi:hypothetical protein
VRVLLVAYPNSREPDAEELQEDSSDVLERLKADPAIFHDPQLQLIPELIRAARLNEFVFPTTVVLDRAGTIRGIWTGYDRRFVHDIGQALERIRAEKGPKEAS